MPALGDLIPLVRLSSDRWGCRALNALEAQPFSIFSRSSVGEQSKASLIWREK